MKKFDIRIKGMEGFIIWKNDKYVLTRRYCKSQGFKFYKRDMVEYIEKIYGGIFGGIWIFVLGLFMLAVSPIMLVLEFLPRLRRIYNENR